MSWSYGPAKDPKAMIVPIPGTPKASRMVENTAAVDVVLTISDLRELEDGLACIEPNGDRYPPEQQRVIDG
ncbi:MAG: hypothetical protein ABIQ16_17085 [Polyangiaceae bacterium]